MASRKEPAQSDRAAFSAVNAHVGMRLRVRREMLALSEREFASAFQLAVAELKEIEAGHREVNAKVLFRLANLLEVPVAWFFEGMSAENTLPMEGVQPKSPQVNVVPDLIRQKEYQRMLAVYFDELTLEAQERLVDIARLMSRRRSK